MRRIQFFEIADQSWCPRIVRDGVTDYLQHAIDAGRVYAPAAPVLARVLRESGRDAIIDLAAGGGGPWRSLLPVLHAGGIHPTVTLTDWRPNTTAFQRTTTHTHGQVQGHVDPVDARAVPPTLHGARTMFSALHHFREDDIRRMLRDAANAGEPFLAFEATHRSVRAVLFTCLTPLMVLLMTPAIRPFQWSRVLFTYLIPLIPLVVLWDGIVSCLRTYTPEELERLATNSSDGDYEWQTAELGDGPLPVTALWGRQRNESITR